MNAIGNPTFICQLIFRQISDGVLIYTSIQHGVCVNREFCTNTLQERIQVTRVTAAVISHFLQVLQFPRKPGSEEE
jgi:hypothetical protein